MFTVRLEGFSGLGLKVYAEELARKGRSAWRRVLRSTMLCFLAG